MTNPKQNREKNSFLDSKIPRWLQGKSLPPGREDLPIDEIEEAARNGEGEVVVTDVAKHRVPHKWKIGKRVRRRIAEMEELHEFVEKKKGPEVDEFLEKLEKATNSMVE